MAERNIIEQSGVGYLLRNNQPQRQPQDEVSSASSSPSTASASFANEAMITLGTELLQAIAHNPEHAATVNQLVDEVKVGADAIRPVLEELAKKGLLEFTRRDSYSNHTVQVTELARRLIGA